MVETKELIELLTRHLNGLSKVPRERSVATDDFKLDAGDPQPSLFDFSGFDPESDAIDSEAIASKDFVAADDKTAAVFQPDDGRLADVDVVALARSLFPKAIAEGRLSESDVKFLRLWKSGTYFQTAPIPILFPYDENVADIAERDLGRKYPIFADRIFDNLAVTHRRRRPQKRTVARVNKFHRNTIRRGHTKPVTG